MLGILPSRKTDIALLIGKDSGLRKNADLA